MTTGRHAFAAHQLSLHRTVVMVGMMGCGKTAIGRALAQRLEVPFADSDSEIETAANASIAEIFARDGETFFRAREAEVIDRLMTGPPSVLSTGGGAYLSAETRHRVARRGVAVWLDAPLDVLWERVRHKDTRPLLRTPDPRGTLAALWSERTPVYAQAGLRMAVRAGDSIEATTQGVIELLATRPDILEVKP